MQKKLIALALASLAGSAFAQSNVTIYGVMDVSETFIKATGGQDFAATAPASVVNGFTANYPVTTTGGVAAVDAKNVARLDNNSSYIGFKGVEDLGNGLKAVWQFENGINGDTGNWGTARDTFVGLTGAFGTAVAGTLTHPLRAMNSKVELLPGAAGVGTVNSLTGTIAGIHTGADDRATNAVAYISPSFSGFSAAAAWVNGENRTNNASNNLGVNAKEINARGWQVAGQYENGPLFAALGYHDSKDQLQANNALGFSGLNTGADESKAKVWRAAAAYTFSTNTKVTALYDSSKYTQTYGVAAGVNPSSDSVKRNAWAVGVAQNFGKHNVGLEYSRAGKLSGTACGNYSALGLGCDNTDAKLITVMYTYDLSKRTMLHARYSKLSQDQSNLLNVLGTQYGFYNNGLSGTAGTGADVSAFSFGLRHSF